MELKAHFSNIHKVIIHHPEQAQTEIVAAIAWFTVRDIFEVLCKKARSGIKVSVALIGDEINQGPGGLKFQKLSNFGGKTSPGSIFYVWRVPSMGAVFRKWFPTQILNTSTWSMCCPKP
jgi:hypothetical protein